MRNRFASILITLVALPPLSEASTLIDIYHQALNNDHTFKAARAAHESGLENKNIGLSNLLPQITAAASWSDSELDTSGIQSGAPFDGTSETTSSGYSVTLQQPLFDLAAWHSYKRGKVIAKAAEAQFNAEQQSLIIRTAAAYFDVLRAIDNFETAKAEENANSHQLEQTQKRFEVGLTAITEVHEAQAAYDNSLARRLLEEGNVGIKFEALEVITGQPYQNVSPLKEDFPIVPPSPNNRKDWVAFATQNNFTLASASLNAEALRQLANEIKAGHFPKVSGSLQYSDTTEESIGGSIERDIDSNGHTVGLTLSVPIFTGGAISSSRRQAANNYLEAKETYLQIQRDTVQQARSLHLTVLTDVATIKARKQAITSSQSALEATQAGYEVGTRDLVDVLQAQRSLYAAQSNYSDALYTYVVNTLRLKEVAGLLTEKDIIDLNAWLNTSKKVYRYSTQSS